MLEDWQEIVFISVSFLRNLKNGKLLVYDWGTWVLGKYKSNIK